MADDLIEYWLNTHMNAIIGNTSLKPIEHQCMKGKPLSSQHGQAILYYLIADNGKWWLLKKFLNNKYLDKKYLRKVKNLLPSKDGFVCGTKREILTSGALNNSGGFYYSKEFDDWLDGTILMPRIAGCDWASLSEDLRAGKMTLDTNQRLTLCLKLTELIKSLEDCQGCHRDLSCGNVFIDTGTWQVYLIDFDSFYHPSLSMPQTTTCGTAGYISHLAFTKGQPDASKTWCQYADRYALAILNIEFLLVNPSVKATGDGGIFDQQELASQSGKNLNTIIKSLNSTFPQAAQMLEASIKSQSFADCPSPKDWLELYNTMPGFLVKPPSIADLNDISGDQFMEILAKCKAAVPVFSAPNLDNMLDLQIQLPKAAKLIVPAVSLPPDPWQKT